jgi:primosomal protein N' (replication factor Y)
MRLETGRIGKAAVLSRDLQEAISLRLARAEQTILFLNRRGFATSLVCPKCGFVAACDHCSVSLTYHKSDDRMRCHVCGASRLTPTSCPSCKDPAFRYAGVGTQRVETVLAKLFPRARIQRMDADVTTTKDAYERILGDFRTGRTDILIGTQMIAKGLHFPNVTLVGVVYADLSLHLPDFRAGERTFQLLAQVAGRAGRGDVPGEVIVQTYTPFQPAIQAARRVDYDGFSEQELEFRRELSYPPFARLLCLHLKGPEDEEVARTAQALAEALRRGLPLRTQISEASPAPLARAKGLYRYQVTMRSPSPRQMATVLRQALRETRMPRRVTCAIDMDAMSLM